MTSLLGRLLPLFTGARRVEDLFTEAVARLFERRPELCLSWLEELNLITPLPEEDWRYIRVTTQKSFVALDEHGSGSRPDLIVEVHRTVADAESESPPEVVMIESKIGSWEGQNQLKRYAEHLDKKTSAKKTLVYITRAYDPKAKEEITTETQDVEFIQLRWYDFYTFLQTIEMDAFVKEVVLFMEEQGMARSYYLSATDLIALSGVTRAFEILDETLDSEVRAELESFMDNKVRRDRSNFREQIRADGGYFIYVSPKDNETLGCYLGYHINAPGEYPVASVGLWVDSGALARNELVGLVERISLREDWATHGPNDPESEPEVWRELNLSSVLAERDHTLAIKRFFIDSIRQLREELTEFKKEHPDLPWNGEKNF